MSRPNSDHITERGRRFAERQQRREALQQAAEEIQQDRSFSRTLRRVAEESLQFRSQQVSDEGSSLTNLQEAKSVLQALAGGDGDAGAFATLESDSDSEESVVSRYKSSHDTPNDPEEDGLYGSSTSEPTEEITLEFRDRQSPRETDCIPIQPAEEAKARVPTTTAEEAKDRIPTPPVEEAKDRVPTPIAEEARNCTPPKERRERDTQSEQPDDTMPYPYPKYRDDPDAEAHVYAFL